MYNFYVSKRIKLSFLGNGVDYASVNQTLVLNSNTNVEECVTIAINNDTCLEGNEQFEVLLTEDLINVELLTSSAVVTIEDDDSKRVCVCVCACVERA